MGIISGERRKPAIFRVKLCEGISGLIGEKED